MFRFLGRALAIVAVMASAVNAQCALSCSLQASHHVRPSVSLAQAAHAGHACCPDLKSPARNEAPRQKQPCPTPVVVVTEGNFIDAFQFAGNLHLIDLTVQCPLVAVPEVRRRALTAAVELSDSYNIPASSILRV